jgi:alkylation response protein AidB-like acyl-CoA dehydrogenase
MSEPDAGPTWPGLRTRAVLDGDHFVVNGQKVWTSGAHDADVILAFVRTDPDAPKHKGISACSCRPTARPHPRPFGSIVDRTTWTSTRCSSTTSRSRPRT